MQNDNAMNSVHLKAKYLTQRVTCKVDHTGIDKLLLSTRHVFRFAYTFTTFDDRRIRRFYTDFSKN